MPLELEPLEPMTPANKEIMLVAKLTRRTTLPSFSVTYKKILALSPHRPTGVFTAAVSALLPSLVVSATPVPMKGNIPYATSLKLGRKVEVTVGVIDGVTDGVAEGCVVGIPVGIAVGATDGVADGKIVGSCDGVCEGAALGAVVGSTVVDGAAEGINVGIALGTADGVTEGVADGAVVGLAVG